MKLPLVRLLPLLFLGGCAAFSPLNDKGGKTAETAADGSSTSITREQAMTIAQTEVTKREGWPRNKRTADGNIHGILYSMRRINHGRYRVEAQRSTTYPNHPCALCDPTPPAVMVIDRQGQVTHYELKEKSD